MRSWLLLGGAVLTEVAATLSLKGALDHPWLYAVVALGYLTAFALLSAVLARGMPLGVAYGIWAALGVGITAVMAAVLYGEAITPTMTIGLVLVIAGVLVVELGSHVEERRRHEGAR